MNDDIVFECTRLKNSTKRGVIKPNPDGSYTQVIGGLNVYNSKGDFYDFEAGKNFFLDQSSFQRKINRGVLRSEYGHPEFKHGMSMLDFKERILKIKERNVCGTWRKISLSKESMVDDKNNPFIPIIGTIMPSGPYEDALRRAFEKEGEQVCFSIRSFTRDTPMARGGMKKSLLEIITFDYVNEPGIYSAEKLLSPSLESIEEMVFDRKEMINTIDGLKAVKGTSLESGGYLSLESFKDKLLEIEDRERETIKKERSKSFFYRW